MKPAYTVVLQALMSWFSTENVDILGKGYRHCRSPIGSAGFHTGLLDPRPIRVSVLSRSGNVENGQQVEW